MSSGVKVQQEVINKFKEMQQKKTAPYIIFKIQDCKEVVIDKVGCQGDSFETFQDHLMKAKDGKEGRYAIYDVIDEAAAQSTNKTGKLVCVLWAPDVLPVKQKMLYTSSFDAVRRACVGFHRALEAHDDGDLVIENFKN